jgi:hypothetical protein
MHRILTLTLFLGAGGAFGAAAAAAPTDPAPTAGAVSPPPAWVETATRDRWLAFSSFCWTGTEGSNPPALCVDFIPPSMRDDVPRISLRRGQVVRFHLGFTPAEVSATVGKKTYRLHPRQVAAWRVRGKGGTLLLAARAESGGDASYVARIRIRPGAKAQRAS